LREVGFKAGQYCSVEYHDTKRKITISTVNEPTWDSRVVSPKNYKYRDGVRIGSRIDLKNNRVFDVFDVFDVFGEDTEILMIYSLNRIVFCETPKSKSIRERLTMLGRTIRQGLAFKHASLFGGVG
jgi:hypothetical protein